MSVISKGSVSLVEYRSVDDGNVAMDSILLVSCDHVASYNL